MSGPMGRLDDVDLTLRLKRAEEGERLADAQERLLQLRLTLAGLLGTQGLGPPVCVLVEGWDASGKGGCIRRLVGHLDPRHVRVVSFSAPTPDELRHNWLRRFWPALPGWGGMAVLDRSWYGRVLVERVEGFATKKEWKRSYDEIVDFEEMLAHDGTVILKFWLHISHEEQAVRFKKRQNDPLKRWKLTEEDWRNRRKRTEYEAAVEEMIQRTDVPTAPWIVVAAESKRWARVNVIETVVEAIEVALDKRGITVPDIGRD